MFGRHKQAREKSRLKKQKAEFSQQQKDYEAQSPERQKVEAANKASQVDVLTKQNAERRKQGRAEGREQANEVLGRNYEGLTPERRHTMQSEANKQVKRGLQSANRNLLGDQSQRGVVGRGGVGYAQQRELQGAAQQAQGQAMRDIDKLDSDLAMKKLAAAFGIEQGEASQSNLDYQQALDELDIEKEKRKQDLYEKQFHRQFNRL